jgi:glycosyltransferase involved in cell wall biosynthesis
VATPRIVQRPAYSQQTAQDIIEAARRLAQANPSMLRGQRTAQWLLRVTDPQQPLNVLHISGAAVATPPVGYGGLENVVNDLCLELRGLGHTTEVFAPATSTIAGLIPTIERPVLDGGTWADQQLFDLHHDLISRWVRGQFKQGRIGDAQPWDTVIAHLGSLYDPPMGELAAHFQDLLGIVPLVVKHSPLDLDRKWSPEHGEVRVGRADATYAELYWQHLPLVALGDQDRAKALFMFPQAWMVHAITSGLAEGNFIPLRDRRLNAVGTLGRINHDKGQADAIRLAKVAGKHIIVAGNIDNQAYFDNEVHPLVDIDLSESPEEVAALLSGKDSFPLNGMKPLCIYVGPIGGQQKLDFFSGIQAYLLPLHWDEPQGIVFLEAWAAGTPVVAHRRGSVEKLMEPHRGQWGFDPEEGDELAFIRGIQGALTLDRSAIQRWARERFHMRAAAQEYVDLQRFLAALWWLRGGDWFSPLEG